jgi:hypothetical protein
MHGEENATTPAQRNSNEAGWKPALRGGGATHRHSREGKREDAAQQGKGNAYVKDKDEEGFLLAKGPRRGGGLASLEMTDVGKSGAIEEKGARGGKPGSSALWRVR